MGPPSNVSRPPPLGSCPASIAEPTNFPVIESETLLEDVLKPLEQALEDCRGHTKVSPGVPERVPIISQMQVGLLKSNPLILWAVALDAFCGIPLESAKDFPEKRKKF